MKYNIKNYIPRIKRHVNSYCNDRQIICGLKRDALGDISRICENCRLHVNKEKIND